MMWLWLSVISAVLLGLYDVAKKNAIANNGVLEVLLFATGLSTLMLSPLLISSVTGMQLGRNVLFELDCGTLKLHLLLIFKSCLVSISWICGIIALKHIPLTTVGIVKASRPVFVLLGCLLIFDERLNFFQWSGVILAIVSLYLLGRSSREEGISFSGNRWVFCLFGSVLFGVVSALFDKYLMVDVNPLFVQSWCDLYITVILAVCVLIERKYLTYNGDVPVRITWDWQIFLIALFITVSDFCYFYSLTFDGSMLSVISMIRRSSVIVTFIFGSLMFKEKKLRAKGFEMALLLLGMVLLMYGSY